VPRYTDAGVCTFTVATLPVFVVTGHPIPTVTVMGVPPGNVFPLGVTTVTGTAANGVPLDAYASYTVTVADGERPTLTIPPDIVNATPDRPWPHDDCPGPGVQCGNPACPWWKGPTPAALDTSDWTEATRADERSTPRRKLD
jgi:hypothetical protein